MTTMKVSSGLQGLLALASKLDQLEQKLDSDHRVTAGSKDNIVKQIEELRRKLRHNANELEYDNIQNLASKLHEVIHILSDLIQARAVKGADTKNFQKLAAKIVDVTRALNLGGDEELDKDGDGFVDDADVSFLDDEGSEDSTDTFHKAVKTALNGKKPEDKGDKSTDDEKTDKKGDSKEVTDKKTSEDSKKSEKTEKTAEPKPAKKAVKPSNEGVEEDDDSEDAEDSEDNSDESEEETEKPKKSPKLVKKSLKKGGKKKGDEGGFMNSLDKDDGSDDEGSEDEEATSSSKEVTAGLRFHYVGIKKIKKRGEVIRVLKAMYGNNSNGKQDATVYYYAPTEKLFGGDVDRAHSAFIKVLAKKNGYHALATFIPKLIKSGKLVQVKKKAIDVTNELHEDSESTAGYWSYIGLEDHPTKRKQKAIWFEVGDDRFASIPTKRFEGGDVIEADSWIKVNVLGNKDAAGVSYRAGLKLMNKLVNTGKLKVIFHSAV